MHVGIANPRWREKRSQDSRRMRNTQVYVSGKRPMLLISPQQLDYRNGLFRPSVCWSIVTLLWFPHIFRQTTQGWYQFWWTHLLRMENRPLALICIQCEGNHELTVKHIWLNEISCRPFVDIITCLFYNIALHNTIPSKKILDFVKDISLYDSL